MVSDALCRFEMSELRKRKAAPTKDKTKQFQANGSSKINSSRITPSPKETVCWYNVANIFLGTIIAVIVGVKYALYVRELHENNLWFSNIRVRVKLDDTCFFFFVFFLQMSNGRHAENFTPSCLVAWVYDNNESAELLDSIHIPYSFKTF